MKFVPRREKNRKAFSSPDGLVFLSKANGPANGRPMGSAAGKTQESTTAVKKVTPLYDQEKDK
jgi:hypothetical protein